MRRSLTSKLSTGLVTAFAFGALGLSACQSRADRRHAPARRSHQRHRLGVLRARHRRQLQVQEPELRHQRERVSPRRDGRRLGQLDLLDAFVSGVPAMGTSYTAALTAQDVGHQLTACMGSATFDVTNGTTVPVPVHMTCRAAPAPSVPVQFALGGRCLRARAAGAGGAPPAAPRRLTNRRQARRAAGAGAARLLRGRWPRRRRARPRPTTRRAAPRRT